MPIRKAIQNINLCDRESVASPYAVRLVLSTGSLYWVSLRLRQTSGSFTDRHDDLNGLIYLPFPSLSITHLSDLGGSDNSLLSIKEVHAQCRVGNMHHHEKKNP